jgi:HNH endonuclease
LSDQPLLENESWAVVGEFPAYEVSSDGHIRREGRVLATNVNTNGYVMVQLWSNGKNRGRLVHRLVAAAFIGPRPPGHDVNHKDAVKTHNGKDNLEYLSRGDNNRHAYDHGLMPRGEQRSKKLTNSQVREMKQIYATAAGRRGIQKELAARFGVCRQSVAQIISGECWRHIA